MTEVDFLLILTIRPQSSGVPERINHATEAPGDDIYVGFPSKRRICEDDYSQSFFRDIRDRRGETIDIPAAG